MKSPGISITCPIEVSPNGPIPIEIEMRADGRTYWDNEGILDNALTVALVRRDEPGLQFLAKIDPSALMLPDAPLPGRPSDEEIDAYAEVVSETKVLDAMAFGASHPGTADYFVTGAFSIWWAGLKELRVADPTGPLRPSPLRQGTGPMPTRERLGGTDPLPQLESAREGSALVLPLPKRVPQSSPSGHERQPWITVVGFHLGSRGGACGGIFDLAPTAEGRDSEVLIPLADLASPPQKGRWLFVGFVGNEVVPPNELLVTDDDGH